MDRREVMGVLGVAATAASLGAEPSAREHFFGVWKLISYENKPTNGEVIQVYGPNPVGRIQYDKAGRMSAFLMRPGRTAPQSMREATADELRQVQSGFVAYFGHFDVDEATRTVTHHVQGALNPAWPGTDLRRTYEFSGNRLMLRAASPTAMLTLVWEREPD
jgi:hypothetical protein